MKIFLVTINPVDVFLWTLRRNEKDVMNLYDSLSPVMCSATGGSMLNFGYWEGAQNTPLDAQENLCSFFGKLAELDNAHTAIDVGSGFSAPAIFWRNRYDGLNLVCVNVNFNQLKFCGTEKNIEFINSTSKKLPFGNKTVDRVLALESSHHFKPFDNFIFESKRVLQDSGLLVIALPVILSSSTFQNLGILKFTWSSEHYHLNFVKKNILSAGFSIVEEKLVGNQVYEPLADYYIKNRPLLKNIIKEKYPEFLEKILHKSILKMKMASEEKIIDYVILKCQL